MNEWQKNIKLYTRPFHLKAHYRPHSAILRDYHMNSKVLNMNQKEGQTGADGFFPIHVTS
jgi:hypothetical protein